MTSLIFVPFLLVVLLNLLGAERVKRFGFCVATVWTLVQTFWLCFPASVLTVSVIDVFSDYFPVDLAVDGLSTVLLLAVGLVGFAALITGRFTLTEDKDRFNFVNLILLAIAGLNGLLMVTDLFSLYVYIEVVAVSSFVLISLKREKDALEGTFKYIVLSATASMLMLLSITAILLVCGHTSFDAVQQSLHAIPNRRLVFIAMVLFVGAALIKGGLVPFHGWLPDAYSSAPSAVAVFLGGIVTKTAGVYVAVRVVASVFGFTGTIQHILLIVGAVSAVFGALTALNQTDFRRMLAYSSISQMGYILLGLGTGSLLGMAGVLFHLFNHAVFKSQLFVNAAVMEEQTGTRDFHRLGGLGEKMPLSAGTSVIAFLSLAGIPPLSGFWSKLLIIMALWQAGHPGYAVIAVGASCITLAYFLLLQRKMFFGKISPELSSIKEAPIGFLIPAILLSVISIVLGVVYPFSVGRFLDLAGTILNMAK